jgi:hypothetical protein
MGTCQTLARAREEVIEAGETLIQGARNEDEIERCRTKHGDVGGPWVKTGTGGVSPLSLLTFFAAAKKVSAAPHRGNASKPKRNRGCHPPPSPKTPHHHRKRQQ